MTEEDPNTLADRTEVAVRDGRGRYSLDPKSADTTARALELKAKNYTYREIAAELGIAVSSAYEAVQRGLRRTVAPAVEAYRDEEADRLEQLRREALELLLTEKFEVSAGRVTDQEDLGHKIAALQMLLKISESTRKLHGLDSAAKVTVDGGVRYVFGNDVDLDKLT